MSLQIRDSRYISSSEFRLARRGVSGAFFVSEGVEGVRQHRMHVLWVWALHLVS